MPLLYIFLLYRASQRRMGPIGPTFVDLFRNARERSQSWPRERRNQHDLLPIGHSEEALPKVWPGYSLGWNIPDMETRTCTLHYYDR